MDDDVKKFSVKFIETTGRYADYDLFNEDDAWEFLRDLLNEYARAKTRRLTDGQVSILRNLGVALSMRPGSPLSGYIPALVRNFGPSPMSDADLQEVVRWVYMQVNAGGDFEPARKAPVTLSAGLPGERPGVPPKRR
ncbi:MAG: hypothetical protein JNK82_39000 [Myxococcaceae bacterium]|nr:hypothetical protein [Myxococcaceae bacterium]